MRSSNQKESAFRQSPGRIRENLQHAVAEAFEGGFDGVEEA